MGGVVKTYQEHNCFNWRHTHYFMGPLGMGRKCGVCDTVTDYYHRQWWRRVLQVFKQDVSHIGRNTDE